MQYLPLILGLTAMALVLGAPAKPARMAGALTGLAALVAAGFFWVQPTGEVIDRALFIALSAAAIGGGAAMVASRNPVHAALWFALVTLSVCGLFVVQDAPFLAAATTIIYAGAIIVTFLFVIMLARQAGTAVYDQRPGQPVVATFVSFVLLTAILMFLTGAGSNDGAPKLPQLDGVAADTNLLSQPTAGEEPGTVRGFGRSLFGDYVFAVEIAGTLLLVAAIAAIAISPRRQGVLR